MRVPGFGKSLAGRVNRSRIFANRALAVKLLMVVGFVNFTNPALAQSDEDNGIKLSFDIQTANGPPARQPVIREGELVSFDFRITDINDVPLSGLFPAVWIHSSMPAETGNHDICLDKVKTFIGGSLFSRAELDLNVYYVMVMNEDATISVVDPLFGFGGSKLLTMLALAGPGYDWDVNQAQDRVYVSIPSENQIAVIDVNGWTVTPVGSNGGLVNPGRVYLQPGEQHLWVLTEDGAVLYDPVSMEKQSHIKTPDPAAALEFSVDGRTAYLLGSESLHVVDMASMTIARSFRQAPGTVSMAYSKLAGSLYLRNAGSGDIRSIADGSFREAAVIKSDPGPGDMKVTPDGRWTFVVNTESDRLSIIDTAKQRIVQSGRVQPGPEYIAFSDDLAYIRHAGSSDLYMIPLDDKDLGRAGKPIPTIDTPGGDHSPGRVAIPSAGEAIVQAPGSNAVLVANYQDQAVYFYKEGMAAPMGSFNNYSKHPRSVLAIDHSLKERKQKGVYTSYASLPEAGDYEAALFMDSPRVIKCFPFTVEPADDSRSNYVVSLAIEDRTSSRLSANRENTFIYSVTSDYGGSLEGELFSIDVMLASGQWREKYDVQVNAGNELRIEIRPPIAGVYGVAVSAVNTGKFAASKEFSYEIY